MMESEAGFVSLFNKLCEIAFAKEADRACNGNFYGRHRYTKRCRRILKECAWGKLFLELNAPWVGRKRQENTVSLNAYDELSVRAFELRLARSFDDADRLDHFVSKWRHSEAYQKNGLAGESEAVLKFLLVLGGTGSTEQGTAAGYHENMATDPTQCIQHTLPDGPLLSTDSQMLKHKALQQQCYVQYPRELFESVPSLLGQVQTSHASTIQEQLEAAPGVTHYGNSRFFALEGSSETAFETKTRTSLYNALIHGKTSDMQVQFGLPDIPNNLEEKAFGLTALETTEMTDDEGFHETSSYSSTSSENIQGSSCEDIWVAALKLPMHKFYTWEMEGRRDMCAERPYLTEAGPKVFDKLYNAVMKQAMYLVKEPKPVFQMVSLGKLVKDSLNVLIGVSSFSFIMDKATSSFYINPQLRLSGCSPETLQSCLARLAVIGTDYSWVNKFAHYQITQAGLVFQMLLGALENYLHCYRATVLSVEASKVQSPLQLNCAFDSIGKQLRFLANMCMCSAAKRDPNTPKAKFPTGVKLLTYLYQLAVEHSSSEFYPILLSLLKHSAAPYIMFVQNWVFHGVCHDEFGEFMIEVDEQYLAYRDKHYWNKGFLMLGKDKLDCVPMFLRDLAGDIFMCGKSLNLLKLCYPEHYLCEPQIPAPKMEVTFSMKELHDIERQCSQYLRVMRTLDKQTQEQKKRQRAALEEEKQRAVVEERSKAKRALAEINGLIQKAKEAVEKKKVEEFNMLKEQVEEALKQRALAKRRQDEEDAKIEEVANKREVTLMNVEEDMKEQAREELIKYYEELSREVELRERRAQWFIRRHRLDTKRMQFLAQEEAKLDALRRQVEDISAAHAKANLSEELATQPVDVAGQEEHQDPILGVHANTVSTRTPSPSLVSLIASGVKTDALVRAGAAMVLEEGPGGASEDLGLGTDAQDGTTLQHTTNGVTSSTGNDSVNKSRKMWGDPVNMTTLVATTEEEDRKRKTWGVPAVGDIKLVESQLPRGHPSESSIQFALYSDQQLNHEKDLPIDKPTASTRLENMPCTPSDAGTTSVQGIVSRSVCGHPSDSSAQSHLYGPGDANASVTPSAHGHPSNSSAQSHLYGSEDTNTSKPPAAQGHPSNSSAQSHLYGSEDTNTSKTPSAHGHPSNSSAQTHLYGSEDTNTSKTPSAHGHPSDSSAQSHLYGSEDAKTSITPSAHGHPSDSSAQSHLYGSEDTNTSKTPSAHGHPSNSSAQSHLYGSEDTNTSKTPSAHGHPSDSSAQSHLYGSEDAKTSITPSAHGHPSDSSAQSHLYGPGDAKTSTAPSAHGHPSDSSAQSHLYGSEDAKTSITPSAHGHPSDSSAQSHLYGSEDTNTSKTASAHGHPSNSSAQSHLYGSEDTNTSKTPSAHGHPSNSSAQTHLYGSEDTNTSKTPSAHGHPSDSSAQSHLYGSEDAKTSITPSAHGHPSDSSAQSHLYGSEDTNTSKTPSAHGHPSNSSAQSHLYGSEDTNTSKTPSAHGHPSDSSAQSHLYGSEDAKTSITPSAHGHPSDSSAQSHLYGPGDAKTSTAPSAHGHPSDSSAQSHLYGSEDAKTSITPSAHGHPSDSSAQSHLYGSEDTNTSKTASAHGHPSDSSAQSHLYGPGDAKTSITPSAHGHPSDSSAQSHLYGLGDAKTPVTPSAHGHPSDSSAQTHLYRSDEDKTVTAPSHLGEKSVAKSGNVTGVSSRGTPPPSVAQDILYSRIGESGEASGVSARGIPPTSVVQNIMYPGRGGLVEDVAHISTRGHEPAARIKALLYPGKKEENIGLEPYKPLTFEDVWLDSEFESYKDNYGVLDEKPSSNLLHGALGLFSETADVLGEDDFEAVDAMRLMPLPLLLQRSVTAPLLTQISLVNSAIIGFFMEDLQLRKHFEIFRNFLFLEDGEFALSLSDQIFEKVASGITPRELCRPSVLNKIVSRALQLSVYSNTTEHVQNLAFALKWIPEMFKPNEISSLDFLELRYTVKWPVNIVITETSVLKYNKIFSFMLKLKRLSWILQDIWFHLKHIGHSRETAGSPQLRQLQLFRHEMLHFVNNIEGYLSNQIINVTWAELQEEVIANVRNLDELHHRHTEYLNKAIFRSLLNKKAAPVMKIITDIFTLILKFRTQLMSSPWQQDAVTGHVTHPAFSVMCSTCTAFREYSAFLFNVVSKLVRRGYQSHLDDLLLRINFNKFFETG